MNDTDTTTACPECPHPVDDHHAVGGCWHTDRKNTRGLHVYCQCRRTPDGGHYPAGSEGATT